VQYDIIVLDNGSTDGSTSVLRNINGFELIESKTNLGFAGGYNLIISKAIERGYDYIWLLNNDSLVEDVCLEKLVAVAESNPKCALLSPLIKNKQAPHDVQHALSLLNKTRTGVIEISEVTKAQQEQDRHPSRVILWGTALLIRTDAIRKIGFLDERLFAYSEDTDLCLRSLENGYLNRVIFNATVLHESPQHPRKPHYYYYTQRNATLMWRKYVSTILLLKLIRWNLQLARKSLASLKNNPETSFAMVLGIWHGWIGKSGAYSPDAKMAQSSQWLVRTLIKFS
jgi:GT2 family glycosyltransferase